MRVKLATVLQLVLLTGACDSDSIYNPSPFTPFTPPSPTTTGTGTTATIPSRGPCATAVAGERCSTLSYNTICERGDHPSPGCNDILTCQNRDSAPNWESRDAGTCATGCPLAFTLDEPDAACSAPNASTLMCGYLEGTCGCGRARRIADAGTDADAAPPLPTDGGYGWTCVPPPTGISRLGTPEVCPRVRPRIGSVCVKPMTCDYGSCVFDEGITLECSGSTGTNVWQEVATGCPRPSADAGRPRDGGSEGGS